MLWLNYTLPYIVKGSQKNILFCQIYAHKLRDVSLVYIMLADKVNMYRRQTLFNSV